VTDWPRIPGFFYSPFTMPTLDVWGWMLWIHDHARRLCAPQLGAWIDLKRRQPLALSGWVARVGKRKRGGK